MAVNIPGIVSVAVFYIAILVLGIVMGRRTSKNTSGEAVLVADRSLSLFVSTLTLTATIVGGAYLLGSAESAYSYGIVQTVAPFANFFTYLLVTFFYGPKIREGGYLTMFDPLQLKFGRKLGAILFIPQFLGDLFWTAAVLAALGGTISIILDMNSVIAIIISAAVAIVYTVLGGLYSVAYTDVLQLLLVLIGLVLAVPFSMTSPAVDLSRVSETWWGEIPPETIASYIDVILLCVFGGVPWQIFFQRILACRSDRAAWLSTLLGGTFAFLLAIPAMLMGITGSAADWNATDYDGPIPIPDEMRSYILPLVLNYLTPLPVSIIGIGAIAAAVMSSCDSAVLSSSSIICKNVYHDVIRPKASERELLWVLRITIVLFGTLATLIAIFSLSIYGLFIVCADLMYVVLFPQLTLALWMPQSNAYGSMLGFFVSLILRVLGGEPVLQFPAAIKYPFYDEDSQTQLFPHRTFAMLLGTLCIVVASLATNAMFLKGMVPIKYDFLKCYRQRTHKKRPGKHDVNNSERNEQNLNNLSDVPIGAATIVA